MSPPKKFATPQEEIVFGFSQRVLGAHAIFYPENFGHSKEPADVAWVANRCAFLFYMTEGGGSFEKKKKHNLKQMHAWLRKWKAGQPLIGHAGSTHYEFRFEDIDHVVGLSVVDGGKGWCQYHPDEVVHSKDRKLAVCVTLTGSVMRELAAVGSTPRDLLATISELHGFAELPSNDLIHFIRQYAQAGTIVVESQFKEFQNDPNYNQYAITLATILVDWARHHPDAKDIGQIGADLRSNDILWIALANSTVQSRIALPGTFGPLWAIMNRETGIYNLKCVGAAAMKILAENVGVINDNRPGLILTASLDFGMDSPLHTMAITPPQGKSMLEQEILLLRNAVLGPPPGS
ncbi:hypothetical protein NKI36_25275 [Mesorhizobium caraganae]|uniref:Uncharacterized protein n=1 Tax=Mesorhizobium caraganae TaxID=483206 RepID=A0ABV1Z5T7_9HYPH